MAETSDDDKTKRVVWLNDNFLLVSYGSDTIILMGTVQKEEVI